MSFGDSILRGAALLLLASCARPTEVELRLFPCGLAGAAPVKVELAVQGYDAEGGALAMLYASFAIPAGVLSDGYATVGLRPPAGLVRADFAVTWFDAQGEAQVVLHPSLGVPALGEVLELGAEMCAAVEGGTSSTGEGTSTSTGEGTSTSTGDGTSTSASTSTGEGTSTSTGEGTSTSTGEGTSTGDSSTTGEMSMVGAGCNMALDQFFCEHGGPGQLGALLECMGSVWKKADLKQRCPLDQFCPPALGLVDPVPVGCNGDGAIAWACLCQDGAPQACDGGEVSCVEGQDITLCVEDGEGTPIRTRGRCAAFCVELDGDSPYCGVELP